MPFHTDMDTDVKTEKKNSQITVFLEINVFDGRFNTFLLSFVFSVSILENFKFYFI